MGFFGNLSEHAEKATEYGEQYLRSTERYLKLKIFEQLVVSISLLAKMILVGGLVFVSALFLAFGLALIIGQWMDNMALGYLVVAGFFLILAVVAYGFRKGITKKVFDALAARFFD